MSDLRQLLVASTDSQVLLVHRRTRAVGRGVMLQAEVQNGCGMHEGAPTAENRKDKNRRARNRKGIGQMIRNVARPKANPDFQTKGRKGQVSRCGSDDTVTTKRAQTVMKWMDRGA